MRAKVLAPAVVAAVPLSVVAVLAVTCFGKVNGTAEELVTMTRRKVFPGSEDSSSGVPAQSRGNSPALFDTSKFDRF